MLGCSSSLCWKKTVVKFKNLVQPAVLIMQNRQNYWPNVVVNHSQENDNLHWQQERVPGNISYRDSVRHRKKIFIISTSLVKDLRMKVLNHCLKNSFAKFQFFPAPHKKWNFSLKISSVNVTKSAVSCRFRYIYWRNP